MNSKYSVTVDVFPMWPAGHKVMSKHKKNKRSNSVQTLHDRMHVTIIH